jgi:hypothetical protein
MLRWGQQRPNTFDYACESFLLGSKDMNHNAKAVMNAERDGASRLKLVSLLLIAFVLTAFPAFGNGQVSRRPSPTMQKPSAAQASSVKGQPAATPRKHTPEEIQAKLLSKSKPTMGPRVTNTRALDLVANSTMVSTLAQQMKTALAERNSIRLHSTAQAARVGSGAGSVAKGSTGSMKVEAARATSHGMQNPAYVSNTLSQGVQVRQNDCATGKTVLMTVNGKIDGTVFTPDPTYNLYTIKGCNFGTQQGQLHLYGAFKSSQIPLLVNFWSDDSIVATMDPNLSGEVDQNNVHLVLVQANGQQIDRGGEQFYAAREIKTLSSIPPDWITFGQVRDASGWPVTPSYGATLPSIVVSRTSSNRFSGGQDYYNFNRLKHGFTTYSFQFGYYPVTCTDDTVQTTLYTDGSFQPEWDGNNIRVTLGAQTCHFGPYFLLPAYDEAASSYVLAVQVSGPRGVDPLN